MAFEEAPVDSTCFARLAFDPETGECIMQFQKGGVYTIPSLPIPEWSAWINSGSLGRYWNSNVRGNY
jgi:hypothetical protein